MDVVKFAIPESLRLGSSSMMDIESGTSTRSSSLSWPGTPSDPRSRQRRAFQALLAVIVGLAALVLVITIAIYAASRLFAGAHNALTIVVVAGFATAVLLERESPQGGLAFHFKTIDPVVFECPASAPSCEGALPPSCVY